MSEPTRMAAPGDRLPAVPTVRVAALVRPEFPREIEAFAVVGG